MIYRMFNSIPLEKEDEKKSGPSDGIKVNLDKTLDSRPDTSAKVFTTTQTRTHRQQSAPGLVSSLVSLETEL